MAKVNTPDLAVERYAECIKALGTETIPLANATGRILAESLVADRPSPAADVSAMDGYAIRESDLATTGSLTVAGESVPGHAPPAALTGNVMRIFTGAIVPSDFDLVVKREDTEESADSIRLLNMESYRCGDNIRREGENVGQGATVIDSGSLLHAGIVAAAASFGCEHLRVSKRLRVTVLVTGDELQSVDADVQPWQLRDSNGSTLKALLDRPWIEVVAVARVVDRLELLVETLTQALEQSDAVIMTGGVSMGDYDHVPDAIQNVGGRVLFHRLPMRPGRPILGAVMDDGRPIFGLPGNPVSAAVGLRRIALPVLGQQAGVTTLAQNRPAIQLDESDSQSLPLYWFRLVAFHGRSARLVQSKGSGDLVALAKSDGFIEQPPEGAGAGPWTYWGWMDS